MVQVVPQAHLGVTLLQRGGSGGSPGPSRCHPVQEGWFRWFPRPISVSPCYRGVVQVVPQAHLSVTLLQRGGSGGSPDPSRCHPVQEGWFRWFPRPISVSPCTRNVVQVVPQAHLGVTLYKRGGSGGSPGPSQCHPVQEGWFRWFPRPISVSPCTGGVVQVVPQAHLSVTLYKRDGSGGSPGPSRCHPAAQGWFRWFPRPISVSPCTRKVVQVVPQAHLGVTLLQRGGSGGSPGPSRCHPVQGRWFRWFPRPISVSPCTRGVVQVVPQAHLSVTLYRRGGSGGSPGPSRCHPATEGWFRWFPRPISMSPCYRGMDQVVPQAHLGVTLYKRGGSGGSLP
nr:uncharacterized protein LOC115490985 [Taeniopygia guttata]